ncbi:MAG TPA: peptidylprolyl isomerase [Pseudogracilibacillus sp.]|nr:peptidylprolyl isomerase [Pseudogracilibacillus sp.]
MAKGHILLENDETIEFELFAEDAPKTVENFMKLANDKFYDGLTFHRVIPGFVSQGGCPVGNGTGSAGYTIKCETDGNPHKHVEGTLSMAHAGRDTGSCQFFIVHEPQPHLDGVHTVFGQVTSNMAAVKAMQNGDIIKEIVIYGSKE